MGNLFAVKSKFISHRRSIKLLMMLVITLFSAPSYSIIIADGDFTGWNYGAIGGSVVTQESSAGNPGARLNFTNSPTLNNQAIGTAIKTDFSTTSTISGLAFSLQLDVLDGAGGFGQGQGISLLVEQSSNIYRAYLDITDWPHTTWDTLTFNGTFTESSFGLLSGSGPDNIDFSGGVDTSFGFAASNSTNGNGYTLTQYYDNFRLEFTPADSAVPEPSIIALFGLGLVGLGFARRRRS
jgi:hypothetical protein